jgi:hypothetical protein
MHTLKFHEADRKRKDKLRRLAAVPDPTDLADELAVARLMLADAMKAKHTAFANMLLSTIAKLSHSQIAAKRAIPHPARSETLSKVWTLWVMSVARAGRWVVSIWARQSSMPARKSAKVA